MDPTPASEAVLVARYSGADQERWDAFVATAPTATILHTRRFLSYHGDRFQDCSLLFLDRADRVCAVLPAAVSPDDAAVAVSHPGATYGGMLLSDRRHGLDAFQMLELAREALAAAGFRKLVYRSVPPHIHRGIRQSDVYVLWRLGARLIRRDLWNVIDLTRPRAVEAARRRRLRRARDQMVKVAREDADAAYAEFHPMLIECLTDRHGVLPVHTLGEMQLLRSRFPEQISLWLARDGDGACVAGEWIFDLGETRHGQYGVATEAGRALSAQDLLLEAIISDAATRGIRSFSFGTSTEAAGQVLNAGLYAYKASFGDGAVAHDFYELDLRTGGD